MKKLVSLLVAVLMLTAMLAACGGGASSSAAAPAPASTPAAAESTADASEAPAKDLSGDITFMVIDSFDGDDSALQRTTDAFMEANPGVNVTLEFVPATNIKEKFTTSAMSGAGPDVVALDSAGWTVDAAAASLLAPLDEDLAPIADQFQPGPLASGVYNGQYYAVPWYMNNMGLFYNKAILEEAGVDAVPTTWAEFDEALEKVSAIGKKGIILPYFFPSYVMYAFFYQNENPVIDTSGTVPVSALSEDSAKEAFTYLTEWHTKYNAFPESLKDAMSWDQTYAPFIQEEVAFLFCGDWANWALSASDVDYGIAPLPAGKVPATVLGGYTLSINKNTQNYDAAWAYIEWLTAAEQNDVLLEYGRVGARKDIDTAALLEKSPHLEAFIDQSGYTMARPAIVKLAEFDEMFSNAYKEVILGQKDAETALADIDQRLQDFLAQEYA